MITTILMVAAAVAAIYCGGERLVRARLKRAVSAMTDGRLKEEISKDSGHSLGTGIYQAELEARAVSRKLLERTK